MAGGGQLRHQPARPRIQHPTNHQWNHSVGEILTGLLDAGLMIDSFEETDFASWCPWPELMVRDGDVYRLRGSPERPPCSSFSQRTSPPPPHVFVLDHEDSHVLAKEIGPDSVGANHRCSS